MNPSERIDQLIAELTDWRGKTFAGIRKSILEAEPAGVAPNSRAIISDSDNSVTSAHANFRAASRANSSGRQPGSPDTLMKAIE